MAWYDESVFYHIYPLGLTGAPKENDYGEPVHRLNTLLPWIDHIREIGCNALYIGPLFESVGHGYETTDYRKLDSRLGTNEDLTAFVAACHKAGVKVILDGVFNHVGRDFFAFKDLQEKREASEYRDWFCNVNFFGNNEYNDGFSYDNWGGYNLLVKLNQRNPAVQNYLCDTIRMWVDEFDIDGLRLDAADVLDFEFMKVLRHTANEVKSDFWLMGEVIHGDYTRWANSDTLNSVTDYNLHKALYSGHNDHNYFEIAHTVERLYSMGLNHPGGIKLYSFVDNHDVERIYTILTEKANITPVYIMLYTLPGIPSIYYGSEFAIEGKKERYSDYSLRPALDLADYADALTTNPVTKLVAALGELRQADSALNDGEYRVLQLMNGQFAFVRSKDGRNVIVAVNNTGDPVNFTLGAEGASAFTGALSGEELTVKDGSVSFSIPAHSGEIWLPSVAESVEAANDEADKEAEATDANVLPKPSEQAAKEQAAKAEAEAKAAAERAAAEKAAAKEQAEPKKAAASDAASGASDAASTIAPSASSSAATPTAEDELEPVAIPQDKSLEEMSIAELQSVILAELAKLGPVTDQMKRDVQENVWHDSLVNWANSFH